MFPASSPEDWTPLGAPCGDDPVVAALKALAEECVHGRGYCRQVLSLYELSKVSQGALGASPAGAGRAGWGVLRELQRLKFPTLRVGESQRLPGHEVQG